MFANRVFKQDFKGLLTLFYQNIICIGIGNYKKEKELKRFYNEIKGAKCRWQEELLDLFRKGDGCIFQ